MNSLKIWNIVGDGGGARINPRRVTKAAASVALSAIFVATNALAADQTLQGLAEIAQNPFTDVVSIPLQYNLYPNAGPSKQGFDVLDIEPVIPFKLNADYSIVTRTIIPVISLPPLYGGASRTAGLGDINPAGYLVPTHHGDWLWGVGAIAQLPTHSDSLLGNDRWGLGPSGGVYHSSAKSPWSYGALVFNIWSVGSAKGQSYNDGSIQAFVNYNLPGGKGTFLFSAPLITVDWKAASGHQWTVPVGGGIGQIVVLGKLPVNLTAAGYYNVTTATLDSRWQVQLQATLLFPK